MSRREKKKSESELLAEETVKMEAKLRVLKAEMAKSRLEAEVPRTNSGSRWRAGASDIGSVTRYDKDVGDRIMAKPLQPPTRADKPAETQAVLKRAPRPSSSRKPLRNEESASWSVDDVKRWLSNLGLDAYTPQFTENAISGEVLLELGTDDLDYMKITILGHRKVLLKGVEQLKAAANPPAAVDVVMSLRVGGGAPTVPAQAPAQPPAADSSLWMNPFGPVSGGSGGVDEVLHAISGVTLDGRDSKPSSLAEGVYDEEAERRAFQAAVAAWRGTPSTTGSAVAAKGAASSSSSATAITAASASASASQPRRAAAGGSEYPPEPEDGSGGALLLGAVDEAAEAAAFQAAVAAWRSGASDPAAEKCSCYTCFKLFVQDPSSRFDMVGKSFCSKACKEQYLHAQAERAQRAEELAAQARQASVASQRPASASLDVEELEDEPVAPSPRIADLPVVASTAAYPTAAPAGAGPDRSEARIHRSPFIMHAQLRAVRPVLGLCSRQQSLSLGVPSCKHVLPAQGSIRRVGTAAPAFLKLSHCQCVSPASPQPCLRIAPLSAQQCTLRHFALYTQSSKTTEAQALAECTRLSGSTAALTVEDVVVLLGLMYTHAHSIAVQKAGCLAMAALVAAQPSNVPLIAEAGAVACVRVCMARYRGVPSLQRAACFLLGCLADCQPEVQEEVVAEGGLLLVCDAMRLHSTHADVQQCAAHAVANLCAHSPAAQAVVAEAGGVALLCAAMRAHEADEGVQQYGAHALFNLAAGDSALRHAVVAAGGVDVVCAAMKQFPTSPEVQLCCAQALGNLADEEDQPTDDAESDPEQHSEDYACSMSAHPPSKADNAMLSMPPSESAESGSEAVVAAGGLELLVEALRAHSSAPPVVARCCQALANLADSHPRAQARIAAAGGVHLVCAALRDHSASVPVQHYAGLALLLLCIDASNRAAAFHAGAVALLCDSMRLHAHSEEVQQHGCLLLSLFADDHMSVLSRVLAEGGLQCVHAAIANHPHSELVQEHGSIALSSLAAPS